MTTFKTNQIVKIKIAGGLVNGRISKIHLGHDSITIIDGFGNFETVSSNSIFPSKAKTVKAWC